MIEFNLLVPIEVSNEILERKSNNFRIILSAVRGHRGLIYFLIEAEESELLYFTLKYGQDCVWKR